MTIREDRWHGGATIIPAPFEDGDVYVVRSATRHGRGVPLWKVWTVHVEPGAGTPAIIVLPDARELPLGGPLFVFVCSGEAGIATIQFQSSTGSTVWNAPLPSVVTWHLLDNSTQGGLWAFDTEGFIFFTPGPRPKIVSFGSDNVAGTIDQYNYDTDLWDAPIVLFEDFWRGGASTAAGFSLIRKDKQIWGWIDPVFVAQQVANANCSAAAFIGEFDGGNEHWCFGIPDPVFSTSDIYNDVTTAVTSIIFPPIGSGFLECTGSAARGGPNSLLILCYGPSTVSANFSFEAYLTIPQFHFIIQQTPWNHNFRAPLVTLRNHVHIFAGASFDSDIAKVGTTWHERYLSSELAGWAKKPLVPIPLRGQGMSIVPRTTNRAILAMGRDHSALPSYNSQGWEYNDLTESYSSRANKVWTTGTQEQENSWTPASF